MEKLKVSWDAPSEMSKTDILKPKISFFPLVYNEGYKEY